MLQYFMKTYNYNLKDANLIDFALFKNEQNILVQIFCGETKEVLQSTIKLILRNLPKAVCIGTTTDGEILNQEASIFNTVISISTFENTKISITHAKNNNSYKNGQNIANTLVNKKTKLLIRQILHFTNH